jgi:branched-chain amino acid transport system substrate-binding protein
VNGANSLEDKAIAAWLKKNRVDTIYESLRFDGPYNHGDAAQLIKQVQDSEWKVVWPTKFTAPGVKLIAS